MAEEMRATVLGCKECEGGKVGFTGAALGICTNEHTHYKGVTPIHAQTHI